MKKPKPKPEWKPIGLVKSDQIEKLILLILVRKTIPIIQISEMPLIALDPANSLEFGSLEGLLCARTIRKTATVPSTEEQRKCRLFSDLLRVLMLDHRYKELKMAQQEEKDITKQYRLDVVPLPFRGSGFRLSIEPIETEEA